ncbi:MAG: HAD-IA family hydrolase [Burkholderiaceae bacterium]
MNKPALVLDFGGVISQTLFETHPQTEKALGLSPGALTWRGPFDPSTDPAWRQMQDGQMTERDYWLHRTRETGALINQRWTQMVQFVRAARCADGMAIVRPEALAAICQCQQQGVRLAILSNELDLFYGADFRDQLPFLKAFELIVDASHTGVLKPDPASYAFVSDALKLKPQACVFVDDQPRNIDGAIRAGMQTVHFDVKAPAASFARALEKIEITASLNMPGDSQ